MKFEMSLIIFTAIFGDYDVLTSPKIVNDKLKYVCFSDREINCPPWEIRLIKPDPNDLKREIRKYKILSHKYFKNYEYSIWIDGNYTIMSDLSQYIEEWLGNNDIAIQQNHWQNCIYKEAMNCIKNELDDEKIILKQIHKYKKEGYPENNGLIDGSLIVRRHTAKVREFNEMWWDEIKNYSSRDQISFNYVAYKLKMNYSIIDLNYHLDKFNEDYYIKNQNQLLLLIRRKHGRIKTIKENRIEFKLSYFFPKFLKIFPKFLNIQINKSIKIKYLAYFLSKPNKIRKIRRKLLNEFNFKKIVELIRRFYKLG